MRGNCNSCAPGHDAPHSKPQFKKGKKMKGTFAAICGAALWLLAALPSQAITISFDPAAQSTTVGSAVDVALVISGLTDGAAPSLSTFDLDVSFDPAILGFSSAAFGDPVLGDQLDIFGLGSLTIATLGVGTVNLFELSFDSPSDLDALQAGSFTLATLTFDGLSIGTSTLGISINALGDSLGDPLSASIQSGSITSQGTSQIPEPSSLLLLGVAALGMMPFVSKALLMS